MHYDSISFHNRLSWTIIDRSIQTGSTCTGGLAAWPSPEKTTKRSPRSFNKTCILQRVCKSAGFDKIWCPNLLKKLKHVKTCCEMWIIEGRMGAKSKMSPSQMLAVASGLTMTCRILGEQSQDEPSRYMDYHGLIAPSGVMDVMACYGHTSSLHLPYIINVRVSSSPARFFVHLSLNSWKSTAVWHEIL